MIERTHHACFSGDVTCSGCDPCPACQRHVRSCVLPVAVRAAGFDGALLADIHLLQDVVRAAAERMILHATKLDRLGLRTEADQLRKDAGMLAVERIPLSPQSAHKTESDQVLDMLAGYDAGWIRLHDAMENVETVRAEVIRTQVREAETQVPEPSTEAEPRFDVFADVDRKSATAAPLAAASVTEEEIAASVRPIESPAEPNGVAAKSSDVPS